LKILLAFSCLEVENITNKIKNNMLQNQIILQKKVQNQQQQLIIVHCHSWDGYLETENIDFKSIWNVGCEKAKNLLLSYSYNKILSKFYQKVKIFIIWPMFIDHTLVLIGNRCIFSLNLKLRRKAKI